MSLKSGVLVHTLPSRCRHGRHVGVTGVTLARHVLSFFDCAWRWQVQRCEEFTHQSFEHFHSREAY
jgi:hypothetical protein